MNFSPQQTAQSVIKGVLVSLKRKYLREGSKLEKIRTEKSVPFLKLFDEVINNIGSYTRDRRVISIVKGSKAIIEHGVLSGNSSQLVPAKKELTTSRVTFMIGSSVIDIPIRLSPESDKIITEYMDAVNECNKFRQWRYNTLREDDLAKILEMRIVLGCEDIVAEAEKIIDEEVKSAV